jgi:hypothetical protein
MHGATGATNIATRNGWIDSIISEMAASGGDNIVTVDLNTLMNSNTHFDSGGSHPSRLGNEIIEKAVYDAIQSLTNDVLGYT